MANFRNFFTRIHRRSPRQWFVFSLLLCLAPILSGSGYYNTSFNSGNEGLFTGLLAAYSFSEASGTTTADKSGHGNNLTLTNTTWTSSGHTGEAVSFNGTTSRAVAGINASLSFPSGYSAMAWVYTTSDSGSDEHIIVSVEYSGNYPITMECFDYVDADGQCDCIIQSSGNWTTTTSTVKIPLNTWTHVACTYDGSHQNIYINGALNSSLATTGVVDSGSNYVDVGYSVNDTGDNYPGIIDDVRVYNRSLSAAEVAQAMNMPVAP